LPILIKKTIGIPVILADDPMDCVAKGTGVILDNLEIYKKTLLTKK